MFKNYLGLKFFFFACLFFVFCFPSFAGASDVVINEIAWMGNDISSSDEWIELYNKSGQEIDLSGWELKAGDGTPQIVLEGVIAADGYFLLERTNDESVAVVVADQIYTGALGNDGENLELRNAENILIDQVDCSNKWFAGDNDTKQTMERIFDDWQTSLNPGGTPKSANSDGAEVPPEETPTEDPKEEPREDDLTPITPPNQPPISDAGADITALIGQEILFDGFLSSDPDNDKLSYFWNFGDGATDTEQLSKHTYLYPGQYIVSLMVDDGEFSDLDIITVNIYNQSVIISEFMPNPEGTDTENEWIELFNQSAQIANLTNWQLDDQEGGSSPFTFPANSLIAPNQFLVLIRPITKISLNNDNDQVRLFYPDGSLSAEVGYLAEKKEGFSIAFDGSEYFWTKTPTPGSANIISSNKLNAKEENLSANNPEPATQQTQNAPENEVAVNLNQSQSFSALNAPIENTGSIENSQIVISNENNQEISNPQPNQTASLAHSTQSSQKSKLILIISIIISTALLASWGLIMLAKRKNV